MQRAIIPIIAALVLFAPAAARDIDIALNTDFRPQIDFDAWELRIFPEADPTTPVVSRDGFVYAGQTFPMDLSSFVLPDGAFDLFLWLIDDEGFTIAEYPTRLPVSGDLSIPIIIVRPNRIVTKDDRWTDVDGDGAVSAGDLIRYHVEIHGSLLSGTYSDAPGIGASLVVGSVTASNGSVLRGNAAGDEDVQVDVHGLGIGETAVVEFEVGVTPALANQASLSEFTSDGLRVYASDDPDSPEEHDPTITPVGTSALSTCLAAVETTQGEYAVAAADADGDGVSAIADDCPRTPAGAPVDDRGCSLEQFCASRTAVGRPACFNADWMGDELGADAPQDCALRAQMCVPR